MVRNDIDVCHPKRGGEKVLFHKHIFKNEFEAREELKSKNLAPGEIAVARFYVNYEDEYINAGTPSYDAIRMIMAIGGATPHNTNDTYFFNDSFEVGDNDYITLAEIENILQSYYTKEEVKELIKNIPVIDSSNFATKEDIQNINNNIDNINSSINTVEETIETIQEDIKNKVEKTEVYTKTEVDDIISKLNIPNSNEYVTKEEFNSQTQIISEKANISDVYTKNEVDSSFAKKEEVEEFVRIKVSEVIEKDEEVNNTIEAKLDEVISNKEIVTTENVGEVVKEYIDSSLFNGGEEDEWV